jgi:tRNA-modifying protein YgfZ
MNQDWQNFLVQHGAHLHEGTVRDFGNLQTELLATRDHSVLCDLSQFGTIRVSGEEAQKFLQNLLSSDINAINSESAQLSSFNSPKGRVLATFLIWQQEGDYFLQLSHSLTPAMLKKLSMYIMRSKVKISDASEEFISIGLSGNAAADLIKRHFSLTLEKDWTVGQHDQASVIRISQNQYQISTTPQQAIVLWDALNKTIPAAGSACWDWLNIRAGIPVVTPATQEQFVLQMANLDLLGGVSFNKGCYPGQEIVARTHYLGKQKRRMFLAHIDTDIVPVAGNALFSKEMPDQPCGMVMNAAAAPGGGFDLLAVMQISSRETNNVHFLSPEGAALEFLPPPYALPAN